MQAEYQNYQQKEKQITEIEEQGLSQRIGVEFESIQKAVNFLETKRYIVENGLLGKGGCGLVMKACTEESDYLAIKFMINPNSSQMKQCQSEYNILKQFDSPYVIKVYDSISEQYDNINYHIIVMERCAYDLKSYLARISKNKKDLSNSQIYKLCLELAKGLYVLHSKNILHLDIKPGNILFGIDLKWKYADLGISKVLDDEKDHTVHLGGFTAQYSSPEQYQLASCNQKKIITKAVKSLIQLFEQKTSLSQTDFDYFVLRKELNIIYLIDLLKLSDVYSLGIVFMQISGVDIHQKWIVQEKLQQGNYDKCLNPNLEQFNTIIKKMVQYEPSDRSEIVDIIISIRQLIKQQENNQDQAIQQVPAIKKLISTDKLDIKLENYISQQPSAEIIRSSQPLLEQQVKPSETIKKRKIIRLQRKPSIKPIIIPGVSGIMSDFNILSPSNQSPLSFTSQNKSQSQSNTPKLPKINQQHQIQNFSAFFEQKEKEKVYISPRSTHNQNNQYADQYLARKKQHISALNLVNKYQQEQNVEDSLLYSSQLGSSFRRVDSPLIQTRELILPKLQKKQSSQQLEYINLNQQYQLNQYKIQLNNQSIRQKPKVDSPFRDQKEIRGQQLKRMSFSLISFE